MTVPTSSLSVITFQGLIPRTRVSRLCRDLPVYEFTGHWGEVRVEAEAPAPQSVGKTVDSGQKRTQRPPETSAWGS